VLRIGGELLAFQPEHAVRVARFPAHHSDPFDRTLVAQALTDPLTLLTQDAALAPYGRNVSVV
jgi:PIN domain nuclease of toxin-antitoxin system